MPTTLNCPDRLHNPWHRSDALWPHICWVSSPPPPPQHALPTTTETCWIWVLLLVQVSGLCTRWLYINCSKQNTPNSPTQTAWLLIHINITVWHTYISLNSISTRCDTLLITYYRPCVQSWSCVLANLPAKREINIAVLQDWPITVFVHAPLIYVLKHTFCLTTYLLTANPSSMLLSLVMLKRPPYCCHETLTQVTGNLFSHHWRRELLRTTESTFLCRDNGIHEHSEENSNIVLSYPPLSTCIVTQCFFLLLHV